MQMECIEKRAGISHFVRRKIQIGVVMTRRSLSFSYFLPISNDTHRPELRKCFELITIKHHQSHHEYRVGGRSE